ncbi:MAG: hypothetical protein V3S13_03395 [Candidatus Omnitrophota bacterium]
MASRSNRSAEKDTGIGGEDLRNRKGKLSKGSKARRKARKEKEPQSAEDLVKGIRKNPLNRMPTKATEAIRKAKKWLKEF